MILLRTLGGVDVAGTTSAGSVLAAQPKRLALLVFLAVESTGRAVRRDKLLALFWPELDAAHARGALRTTLHRLRQAVGDDVLETVGAEELRIRPGGLACDTVELRHALARGDPAHALVHYRGPFLDGFHASGCAIEWDSWVETQRQELRELASSAAWQLSAKAEAVGEMARAAAFGARALTIGEINEATLRRQLQLMVAAGDRAGAIRTFDEYERRLALELEVGASPETVAFVDSLRVAPRPHKGSSQSPEPRPSRPLGVIDPVSREPDRGRRPWRLAAIGVLAVAVLLTYLAFRELGAPPGRVIQWAEQHVGGTAPITRAHYVVILDSTRRRLIIYGGSNEAKLGDLWRLDGLQDGPRDESHLRWAKLTPVGEHRPSGRSLAAAIYSATSDRMVLFGGSLGWTSPCTDELWILSNVTGTPRWAPVPRTAPWPAARSDHRMVHDPASNRAILVGGHDCMAPAFDDLWILHHADGADSIPRWERLDVDTSGGLPRGLRGMAVGYSPSSNRLIVFGGYDHASRMWLGDVWILANANGIGGRARWTRSLVAEPRPAPRVNSAFGYDPETNRLVIFGGGSAAGLHDDAWVLTGADGTAALSSWLRLGPFAVRPNAVEGAGAVFDRGSERLLLFSRDSGGVLSRFWTLANATGR